MPPTEDFRMTLKGLIYIFTLWDIPALFVSSAENLKTVRALLVSVCMFPKLKDKPVIGTTDMVVILHINLTHQLLTGL